MGKVGDALDHAMAESFNATLQTQLLDTRPSWPTRRLIKSAIFEYIEVFYNRQRRHSALGYLSPQAFEASLGIPMNVSHPIRKWSATRSGNCRPPIPIERRPAIPEKDGQRTG